MKKWLILSFFGMIFTLAGNNIYDWQSNSRGNVVAEYAVESGKIYRLMTAWRILSGDGRVLAVLEGYDARGKRLFTTPLSGRNRVYDPADLSVEKSEYCLQLSEVAAVGNHLNNLKLNPAATRLKLRLYPGGNRVKMELISLEFTPVTQLNKKLPQRYNQLTPVPEVSDAELDRRLAGRKKAVPVLNNSADKVTLSVNGKAVPLHIYKNTFWEKSNRLLALKHFADCGFQIFTVPMTLGMSTHGGLADIWQLDKQIEPERVRNELRKYLKINSDALLMLDILITPPAGWGKANPDEIFRNSKGEYGIYQHTRVRYGASVPEEKNQRQAAFACPSYASEKFRTEAAAKLRELIAAIETMPEGKAVIGVYVNGGTDMQWLDLWDNRKFSGKGQADYSPAALRGYQAYLQAKYGTPEKMAQAYGSKQVVPFTAMQVPRPEQIWDTGKEFFRIGGSSPVSDYFEFAGVTGARRFHAYAAAVKSGSSNRLLAGAYSPNGGLTGFPIHSQQNLTWLLDDPAVDFFSIVPGYMREHTDPVINSGFTGSLRRHNKLIIYEQDLRTGEVGNWGKWSTPFWRAHHNADTYDHKVLRYCVHSFIHGGSYHAQDMDGGWFNTPRAMQTWRNVNSFIAKAVPLPERFERIAVVSGERYWDFQSQGKGRLNAYRVREAIAPVLQKTGVPFDYHLLEDVLRTADYKLPKVIYFTDLSTADAGDLQMLRRRYGRDHRILVYFWQPGIFTGDRQKCLDMLGLKPETSARRKYIAALPQIKDPLLTGISGRMMDNYPYYGMVFPEVCSVSGKNWQTLGVFEKSRIPALAVRRHQDFTEIYVALPGMLTTKLSRNIVREAGMMPLCDREDFTGIGAGMIYVAAQSDGVRQITLPAGLRISESFGSKKVEMVKRGVYHVDLRRGEVFAALITEK